MVELLESEQDQRSNRESSARRAPVQREVGPPAGAARALPPHLSDPLFPYRPQASSSDVSFWSDPEKAGWMQSQGETIKTWRRRWFVLKGGFLFRFMTPNDVVPGTKPRGVLDLNKATDVGASGPWGEMPRGSAVPTLTLICGIVRFPAADGRSVTGRANSIKVTIQNEVHQLLCDTETETVEWMSALEGAMHRAVSRAAGVSQPAPQQAQQQPSSGDLLRSLQQQYKALERSAPPAASQPPQYRPTPVTRQPSSGLYGPLPPLAPYQPPPSMVQVVGYDAPAAGGYGASAASASMDDYGQYNVGMYNIAGAQAMSMVRSFALARPSVSTALIGLAPLQAQDDYSQQQQRYGGYAAAAPSYAATPQSPAVATLPAPWQMHTTADGKPYYFNPMTNVTTWDPPSSFI